MNSHPTIFNRLFQQEGSVRDKRYPAALDPCNLAIDGRDLKGLLLYILKLYEHIRFIPANGEDAPVSWKQAVQQEMVMLLANIAAYPLAAKKGTVVQVLQTLQDKPTPHKLRHLLDETFALYSNLDAWHKLSATGDSDNQLRRDLRMYISSYLSVKLAELRQISAHARKLAEEKDMPHTSDPVFSEASGIWDHPAQRDHALSQRIFAGSDEAEKLRNAAHRIKDDFDAAFHVAETIINDCDTYLADTLRSKKDHPPHIALLITFLELYDHARKELNGIPLKMLDYYYGQVLGIGERVPEPDSVNVHLALEKGFDAFELDKGVLFSAGKDAAGNALFYETARAIVLRGGRAARLLTLFMEKDQHGLVLQYHSRQSEVQPDGCLAAGALPPFGSPNTLPAGRIGFAIASPQFFLTTGERNILLRFELDKDIPIKPYDKDILECLLTGEKGWLSSARPNDGVSIHSIARTAERVLEIDLSISVSQPSAILAFDGNLHEGTFDTDLPVLQCLLVYPPAPTDNNQLSMAAYRNRIVQLNSLHQLRPVKTIITVRAGRLDAGVSFDGVRDLIVQNHESDLDPTKPFFPFTTQPKVGSSFYIGCDDLFYKPVQQLSVNLEWMLPDHFSNYYDKYIPPYDANKFRASLSMLQKRKWRKIQDISIIDLEVKDPRYRSIKIDLRPSALQRTEAVEEESIARFDANKKDGMLKLKLLYPDFGHGIYAQLITSTVLERSRSHGHSPDLHKIVKKQLHDSAVSIKLPPDLTDPDGPYKVIVYDVPASNKSDDDARTMLVKGLSRVIRSHNGSFSEPGSVGATAQKDPDIQQGQATLVNDDNYIERFFGFLRRIKLLAKDVHYDHNRQGLDDVADGVKAKVEPAADFILPPDQELVRLMVDVASSAIDQTVAKCADALIARRKEALTAEAIAAIFEKEFDEANEVINDMIAGKIAMALLTSHIPPPPYTPTINMISVNYLSSRAANNADQWFRIEPFGCRAIASGDALFDEASLKEPAGLLYIGFSNVQPGQELSLLFEMQELSRNTTETPPPVTWKYLLGNDWKELPAECLIADDTFGLQASGILRLVLPLMTAAGPANSPTGGPANGSAGGPANGSAYWWLSASVKRSPACFPLLAGIAANAVDLRFSPRPACPVHIDLPLPAGAITRLVERLPAIKQVTQPLPSCHGRPKEDKPAYHTRVSERLRHRSRAVTAWDYERLVLDQFPEVHQVKCLNNYWEGRPFRGHVTVVPICDLHLHGSPLLTPHSDYAVLREIEQFLAGKASPFVRIHATSPQLSYALIRCRVKFRSGLDKGFYLQRLNDELIALLTPWQKGGPLSFASRVYLSAIMSFIDKREYVDFVEDLELMQYLVAANGENIFCKGPKQDLALIETAYINGHTILTSAPGHRLGMVE